MCTVHNVRQLIMGDTFSFSAITIFDVQGIQPDRQAQIQGSTFLWMAYNIYVM